MAAGPSSVRRLFLVCLATMLLLTHATSPSGQPTGVPSSMPSCGLGNNGDYTTCTVCGPGWYRDEKLPVDYCKRCPVGTFSAEEGTITCQTCPYPFSTVGEGHTSCEAYYLAIDVNYFMAGVAVLLSIYFAGIYTLDYHTGKDLLLVSALPVMDILTDFGYALQTKFFSRSAFGVAIFFLVMPNVLFYHEIFTAECYQGTQHRRPFPIITTFWFNQLLHGESNCQIIWLRMHDWKPMTQWMYQSEGAMHSPQPFQLSFGNYIIGKRYEGLLWVQAIVFQAAYLLLFLIWCVIFSPVVIFLGLIGCWLQQSKIIAAYKVWNIWIGLWTWDALSYQKNCTGRHAVHNELLNRSLVHEFMFETIGQLVLQTVNNYYIGEWSTLAIVSITTSALVTANSLVYYGYKVVREHKTLIDLPARVGFFSVKANEGEVDISREAGDIGAAATRSELDVSGVELA